MNDTTFAADMQNLFGSDWRQQTGLGGGAAAAGAVPTNTNPTGVTDYSAVAGGKPLVPALSGSQSQAITGNLGNLGNLQNLAGQLNTFNAAQAKGQLAANLPGYTGNLAQAATNAGSLLKGQIPADVLRNLQQAAAERGVATGLGGGSANNNAAYLRALGLTSIGLQNQGLGNLQSLIGMTPTGGMFNYAPYLYGTGEQQSANYAANVNAAAPVPASALNAQMQMAQLGQAHGYNASAPRYQVPMGASQSYSPAGEIAGKYAYTGVPASGTASGTTSTSSESQTAPSAPAVGQYPPAPGSAEYNRRLGYGPASAFDTGITNEQVNADIGRYMDFWNRDPMLNYLDETGQQVAAAQKAVDSGDYSNLPYIPSFDEWWGNY